MNSRFLVTAMLGSALAMALSTVGVLGDRFSRPRLIAFGVGCWSAATARSFHFGSRSATVLVDTAGFDVISGLCPRCRRWCEVFGGGGS